jgi:hypothetical protein
VEVKSTRETLRPEIHGDSGPSTPRSRASDNPLLGMQYQVKEESKEERGCAHSKTSVVVIVTYVCIHM